MKRFFTILEGKDKGQSRALAKPLMIVGRSRHADIQINDDDPLISRRHLEIRMDGDAVFVKDISSHGATLNGKRLSGLVSLNSGDLIDIGHIKLRYDESGDNTVSSERESIASAISSELDGTRIASGRPAGNASNWENSIPEPSGRDETRAIAGEGTRMLNASELPNWVAAEKVQRRQAKGVWAAFVIFNILAAVAAAYWIQHPKSFNHERGNLTFKDSSYGFSIEYPSDWSKIGEQADLVAFGVGKEGDKEWSKVNIYREKKPQYATTGLTHGFNQYEEVLKKQYKDGFELSKKKPIEFNGITTVTYSFTTPTVQGRGFYLLNAETRIVIECLCNSNGDTLSQSVFESIMQSFRLVDPEPQQFIDFPMPDGKIQAQALANPAELARKVQEHIGRGNRFVTNKDVTPESLHRALLEYRVALQMSIAGPLRLTNYETAAFGLIQATKLFNQRVLRQRFEIERASKEGDKKAAYWAAQKMMQMVADKSDPAYQEAYKTVKELQKTQY